MKFQVLLLLLMLWLSLIGSISLSLSAQTSCDPANEWQFPVDPAQFRLVQGYSVPSIRHQGRYHTGEDWYGGRGTSAGQRVYAVANGTVTFSGDRAWGVDGGVVILAHDLPTGERWYSMYGHIQSQGDVQLPRRLACVSKGQALGSIIDVRPAPHLHFEMRSALPDSPGAGYERDLPDSLGYLPPSRTLINAQAWQDRAHRWHIVQGAGIDGGLLVPPLTLNDGSWLSLDQRFALRRILPDGRILWRNRLSTPAAALLAEQGQSYVIGQDGMVSLINVETGQLSEAWRITGLAGRSLAKSVGNQLRFGDARLFHTLDDALIALSPDERSVAWVLEGVPILNSPVIGLYALGAVLGGTDAQGRAWVISEAERQASVKTLREGAFWTTGTSGGALLAYTRMGTWNIGIDGSWTANALAPYPASSARALWLDEQFSLAYDGQRLYIVPRASDWLSVTPIDYPSQGHTSLMRLGDDSIVLASSDGQIASFSLSTARLCHQVRVYGEPSQPAPYLEQVGDSLRIALGAHLLALDSQALAC